LGSPAIAGFVADLLCQTGRVTNDVMEAVTKDPKTRFTGRNAEDVLIGGARN
jgi:hypothetical protein